MRNKIVILIILIGSGLTMGFIQKHENRLPESQFAVASNTYMWDNFHLGNYDSIPTIIKKLNDSYKRLPHDKKVTAYLGFVHLWSFSERERKKTGNASFSDDVYKSNRFFKEAIELNPDDARLRGFQAATEICEGALKEKPLWIGKGYFDGLVAINEWPQFNKFAFSLIGSQRQKNTPMYKLGMKFQWQLLNDCSCKELNEKTILADPEKVLSELINELAKSTDKTKKRLCWNSWIAPHNLEGFFMNFGDMLVKEGRLEEAQKIYSAAKLSPSFNEWPFQSALEARIRDVKKNEIEFNKPLELVITSNSTQIFINSSYSCVGCHQMSKKEFAAFDAAN
jgi:hypothetical protein